VAEHNVTFEVFYDSAWHTAPVLTRNDLKHMRGSKSAGQDTEPASANPVLDDTARLYAPRSLASSLYGKIGQNTKGRLSADGTVQISGEVAKWIPTRPVKGSPSTSIQLAGVLRRIGRGTDPIQSALRRYYRKNAVQPVAYWPLEGGEGAATLYDDITNAPISLPDFSPGSGESGTSQFAKGVLSAGSAAVVNIAGAWVLTSELPRTITPTGEVTWQWHVNFGTTGRAGSAQMFLTDILFDDTQPRYFMWQVRAYDDGTVDLKELEFVNHLLVAGPTTLYSGIVMSNPFDGLPRAFQLDLSASGGTDVAWALYLNGQTLSSGTYTPGFSGGMNVAPIRLEAYSDTPVDNPMAYGHQAIFTEIIPIADGSFSALFGHLYETAADRFERLCNEEGVTPTVVGDAGESIMMGPQGTDPFLDQLDEIARTDDASIFETKSDVGLTMRTGISKMNQTPDLTVSYIGQIKPPLMPVFGDEGIRNEVTARNPDDTSRLVQQLAGPHNVQLPEDDPQGVGPYRSQVDVNTGTTNQLTDLAAWRVVVGTFDGSWYAEVTVDLDAAPGLIAAVDALDIGDCLAITDLPEDEALTTFEGIIIGIEGSLPPKRRLVTFYLTPNAPYRVGLMAQTSGDTDPLVGFLDPDGSTTAAAVAAGAASFTVATPSGPLWSTVADDYPTDITMGGQRVSISAVSGGASPQTFTVRTAGYQIRYPVASGSEVLPYQPITLTQ
jgi:hypothetical protein